MPTITPALSEVTTRGDHCHIITWPSLANGDDGAPIQMPGSADRTIQFDGTFGSGGAVVLEGSNDGTTYYTLTDPAANSLSFTSAGLKSVTEVTRYMRPRVTAGDGTTSLKATLLVRRPSR